MLVGERGKARRVGRGAGPRAADREIPRDGDARLRRARARAAADRASADGWSSAIPPMIPRVASGGAFGISSLLRFAWSLLGAPSPRARPSSQHRPSAPGPAAPAAPLTPPAERPGSSSPPPASSSRPPPMRAAASTARAMAVRRRSRPRVTQRASAPLPLGASGCFLPGLKIPSGSSAALTARWAATAPAGHWCCSQPLLSTPMPCSPLTVPSEPQRHRHHLARPPSARAAARAGRRASSMNVAWTLPSPACPHEHASSPCRSPMRDRLLDRLGEALDGHGDVVRELARARRADDEPDAVAPAPQRGRVRRRQHGRRARPRRAPRRARRGRPRRCRTR